MYHDLDNVHDLDPDGHCVDCGWSREHGPCPYNPATLVGKPIGMFHCPECGTMQLAGLRHLQCNGDPGPGPVSGGVPAPTPGPDDWL